MRSAAPDGSIFSACVRLLPRAPRFLFLNEFITGPLEMRRPSHSAAGHARPHCPPRGAGFYLYEAIRFDGENRILFIFILFYVRARAEGE